MDRLDPVRSFLESVQDAKFEQGRCYRKYIELDAKCRSITGQMSGMPGGSGGDKHKDGLLAALADQGTEYLRRYREAEEQAKAVEDFINRLQDTRHRAVLLLRYVDQLRWPQVVDELEKHGIYYTERQVFRIHGDALQAARQLWATLYPPEEGDPI